MFLPTSDKLLALSEADGSETASVELPQNCSTSFSGAISEKKLLQPTERGVSYIGIFFTCASEFQSHDIVIHIISVSDVKITFT